jgi:hypothetical protein
MDFLASTTLPVAPLVASLGGAYAWYTIEGGSKVITNGMSTTGIAKRLGTRVVVAGGTAWVLNEGLNMTQLITGKVKTLQPLLIGLGLAYVYSLPSNDSVKGDPTNSIKKMLLKWELSLFMFLDKYVKDQ